MMLATRRTPIDRRSAFTLLEVLVVVAILVILAGVGVVGTTRYLEDARKGRAQLACQGISSAVEAYKSNPANTMSEEPSQPSDLLNPPFGGTAFLKNGQQDLIDPWGQPYQFQKVQQGDGNDVIMVFTRSPKDGTPISNYGIGPASKMQ
jgi:general secretion pathway protein G